jgi:hypothetical protein
MKSSLLVVRLLVIFIYFMILPSVIIVLFLIVLLIDKNYIYMYSLTFTMFMFNSRFMNASKWGFFLDMDYRWLVNWICNVFADYKLESID